MKIKSPPPLESKVLGQELVPMVVDPTEDQELAKARFHRNLSELSSLYSKDSLNIEQVAQLAGVSKTKLEKWLGSPDFTAWFMDSDTAHALCLAAREASVRKLREIMRTDVYDDKGEWVSSKTQLAAAKELLLLGDAYPAKRTITKFLDKDIEKMPEHEVDGELEKIRGVLNITPKASD